MFGAFVIVCIVWTPVDATTSIGPALRLAFLGATAGFAGTVVLRSVTRQVLDRQRVLREEAQVATLAHERARIARDLHDHVGARLTGMALLAEREQAALPQDRQAALQLIQQTIRQCLEEIRDVVWALSHARREVPDVLATLRRRAEDLAEAAGLDLSLEMDPLRLPSSLDATTSLALLAIVREALTNVVKHSGATKVHVRAHKEGERLLLEVIDNGRGITGEQTGGRGLHNMRSRTQEQRGTFLLEDTPGGGLAVRVRLPL